MLWLHATHGCESHTWLHRSGRTTYPGEASFLPICFSISVSVSFFKTSTSSKASLASGIKACRAQQTMIDNSNENTDASQLMMSEIGGGHDDWQHCRLVCHAKPGVCKSRLETGFGDFLCMLAQTHCVSWSSCVLRHTRHICAC